MRYVSRAVKRRFAVPIHDRFNILSKRCMAEKGNRLELACQPENSLCWIVGVMIRILHANADCGLLNVGARILISIFVI